MTLGIVALVVASFWTLDLQWAKFVSLDGARKMGRFLGELLAPTGDAVGRVLLSYCVDPFLVADETAISYAHTQDLECRRMAETWRELGFAVDVTSTGPIRRSRRRRRTTC